jgi:hypothetical protein
MEHYRQCVLRNPQKGLITTTWLPEKFMAKHRSGQPIKLKSLQTGEWSDGWLLYEVGTRMLEDIVKILCDGYRWEREASDI